MIGPFSYGFPLNHVKGFALFMSLCINLPPTGDFMKVANTILDAIGHTPLVRLNKVTAGVTSPIYAKVECMNPGGSIKDRVGAQMIAAAEKSGHLKPGGTIIEPTAGNTGVGIAMVAAVKGYKCICVLPDKMSEEKRALLRAYGAEVIVTPTDVPPDSPQQYIQVANRLGKEIPNSFRPDQYNNPENPMAHYLTTGPEIWEQTEGKIDVLVVAMGTCGTISGNSRYLKEKNPKITVVGVDPEGSILSGDAPKAYKVEGIGEDFIPRNFHPELVDEMIRIGDKESFYMTRRIAREEGILVGGSSGTAVAGAVKYAMRLTEPKNIVVILPDTGRNYITKIFSDQWLQENGFIHFAPKKTTIREILDIKTGVQKLLHITPDSKASDAVSIMHHYQISQIPVIENGVNVGSIHEDTLMKLMYDGSNLSHQTVGAIMGSPLPALDVTTNIAEAYRLLIAGTHAILVVDHGKPVGVISRMDLITYWQSKK
jgi:cystathionine beta-synthase